MMAAARSSSCARSSNEVHRHFSNASRAALTARSASAIPASATAPTTSSGELGLMEAIVLPVKTFSPLITSGYSLPRRVRISLSALRILSWFSWWTKFVSGAFS